MNPSELSSTAPRFNQEIYDRYSVPVYFDPYAMDLISRIDPSTLKSVLEIACGTGAVTRHLRKILSSDTKLVASDLNSDMLEYAKKKLQSEKIEWAIADASQLPFADESFDLVICQFGFMFAIDKPKAFREAHRILRAEGSLLFNTWDKLETNEAAQLIRRLFAEWFGELPSESLLPFAMHDHQQLRSLLEEAAFGKITIESVAKKAIATSSEDAAISGVKGGQIYNEIMKRNPAALEKFFETLVKEFKARFGDAPMISSMQAVVSRGWKK